LNDSHATDIICEDSGGFILVKFTHSKITNSEDNKRSILRSCSIIVYTLNYLWRIANGCASSMAIINQVSIPIDEYMNILPNGNSDKKILKNNLSNSSVQSVVRTNNRTNHIVIAIRPVGDITNTGSIYMCICI
jgi:hypothetical protein